MALVKNKKYAAEQIYAIAKLALEALHKSRAGDACSEKLWLQLEKRIKVLSKVIGIAPISIWHVVHNVIRRGYRDMIRKFVMENKGVPDGQAAIKEFTARLLDDKFFWTENFLVAWEAPYKDKVKANLILPDNLDCVDLEGVESLITFCNACVNDRRIAGSIFEAVILSRIIVREAGNEESLKEAIKKGKKKFDKMLGRAYKRKRENQILGNMVYGFIGWLWRINYVPTNVDVDEVEDYIYNGPEWFKILDDVSQGKIKPPKFILVDHYLEMLSFNYELIREEIDTVSKGKRRLTYERREI